MTDYPSNQSYTLLDFGSGKRLEQWGPYRLIRPDPTASGSPANLDQWHSADATYESEKGKGEWVRTQDLPENWPVRLDDIELLIKLAPYKHNGVFPEQLDNWRWMRRQAGSAPLSILNLFAYTGGATVALTKDGHKVTHVDASKPSVNWAKENAARNHITDDRTRWIVDDVPTFVGREIKRGNRYDAIIVDPPAYGHGSSGKTWRVERDLGPLLEQCVALLSDHPFFIVLNGYAHHDTPDSFRRLITGIIKTKRPHQTFNLEPAELTLTSINGRNLSTGIVMRCRLT